MKTPDIELRLQKPVYSKKFDTGGMFRGVETVHKDIADDCDLPYLASVSDGWGGGVGKRHSTEEDAKRDLGRLREKMFG